MTIKTDAEFIAECETALGINGRMITFQGAPVIFNGGLDVLLTEALERLKRANELYRQALSAIDALPAATPLSQCDECGMILLGEPTGSRPLMKQVAELTELLRSVINECGNQKLGGGEYWRAVANTKDRIASIILGKDEIGDPNWDRAKEFEK